MLNKFVGLILILFIAQTVLSGTSLSLSNIELKPFKTGIQYEHNPFLGGVVSSFGLLKDQILLFISPRDKYKVVIDPGHGGNDTGAISEEFFEKDINLAIAKKLKIYLENRGCKVVLTRDDDSFLYLKERVDVSNTEKPDLFISIHVNTCTDTRVRGAEIHWYTNKSKNLAEDLHDVLSNKLQMNYGREILNSDYYVLRNTNVPSILIETGYMTNEEEKIELTDKRFQNKISKAIGEGIVKYLIENKNFTTKS